MTADISTLKNDLRETIRRRLNAVGAETVTAASRAVSSRLAHLASAREAKCIGAYLATRHEIDLEAFLTAAARRGCTIVVPATEKRDGPYLWKEFQPGQPLEDGPHGIRQPAVPGHLDRPPCDIVLVPAMAFDPSGHRLGHGGGHYDRLLAETPGLRVGVAFDFQLLPSVPSGEHDQPVDLIVTERRLITCRGGPAADSNVNSTINNEKTKTKKNVPPAAARRRLP